jgi:hypothetical protein
LSRSSLNDSHDPLAYRFRTSKQTNSFKRRYFTRARKKTVQPQESKASLHEGNSSRVVKNTFSGERSVLVNQHGHITGGINRVGKHVPIQTRVRVMRHTKDLQ